MPVALTGGIFTGEKAFLFMCITLVMPVAGWSGILVERISTYSSIPVEGLSPIIPVKGLYVESPMKGCNRHKNQNLYRLLLLWHQTVVVVLSFFLQDTGS